MLSTADSETSLEVSERVSEWGRKGVRVCVWRGGEWGRMGGRKCVAEDGCVGVWSGECKGDGGVRYNK